MAELHFQIDDPVEVRGECGHSLVVDDVSFSGSVRAGEELPQNEKTAFYTLRCNNPKCARKYQWQSDWSTPRQL